MKKMILLSLAAVCGIAAAAFLFTGCEDASANYLEVEPNEHNFDGSENSKTFIVTNGLRNLSLPLEWSVSDPSLGVISASEGISAVYSRTSAEGINIIMVEDQYGSEGIATVRQF